MISRDAVTNAVHVRLQTIEAATGLVTAPKPATNLYGVIEPAAGPLHDDGDQADPERHLLLNLRIRSVAINGDLAFASRAALQLADRYETSMADRSTEIEGDGWIVRRRTMVSSSGVIAEGTSANVVDDYELWVVPGPPATD